MVFFSSKGARLDAPARWGLSWGASDMTKVDNRKTVAMVAERFREAATKSIDHARGTYIYEAAVRDIHEKTSSQDPCGYSSWLDGLLTYCEKTFCPGFPTKILDVGCGTGELTVMMNLLGYDAVGADVNHRTLELAKILAVENQISEVRFVHVAQHRLPFEADSFDIITMISVLEHMDDVTLTWLVPELARVCRGIVFVQVPSRMKLSDDHTGLKFVPWLPSRIAAFYVALRGRRYRYQISDSQRWDVVYRDLAQIERYFSKRFEMHIAPSQHSFPQCTDSDAVLDIRKQVRFGPLSFPLRIPILTRHLGRAAGMRMEHFYPYYNLVFRRLGECA